MVSQKNGVSSLGLQKAVGLGSYHTAWEWPHQLRRAMVRPNRDKLSGLVEVNEAFVGGENTGKRDRGADGKTLVLIAAEDTQDGIGRIRLSPIRNASEALTTCIQQMVTEGSTIRTDGWSGYSPLGEHGYIHLPISNSNTKEHDSIVASLLKRWIIDAHHGAISHKNLAYYLDEFTFRFNRRTSRLRGKFFLQIDTTGIGD